MNFTGMLKDGTLADKTILITGGGLGLENPWGIILWNWEPT